MSERSHRLLISAGPTHEPIDDVRYLGNRSSGKMGYAIAQAGLERGFKVHLVSGPVCLPDPDGVDVHRVQTALEMQSALERRFAACDALVMAAAVADYRPKERVKGKIKKGQEEPEAIELAHNPDILHGLSNQRSHQVIVGFALEVDQDLSKAEEKRRRKGADLLVLNGPANLGSESGSLTVLQDAAPAEHWREITKEEFASWLVRRIADRLEARDEVS